MSALPPRGKSSQTTFSPPSRHLDQDALWDGVMGWCDGVTRRFLTLHARQHAARGPGRRGAALGPQPDRLREDLSGWTPSQTLLRDFRLLLNFLPVCYLSFHPPKKPRSAWLIVKNEFGRLWVGGALPHHISTLG